MTKKTNKTRWHHLLARALKELLSPVNIQVLTEVPVTPEPPRADIILLRRTGRRWTRAQRQNLADGLRDTDAGRLLIEFKYTESITDLAIERLFVYDHLYRQSENLKRHQLQSFLISAKTPSTDILKRHGFQPSAKKGIHASRLPMIGDLRVILLNELADTPHNALIKCFASRSREKSRAFEILNQQALAHGVSSALKRATYGLSRIMMAKVLEHPEDRGWTFEDVLQLGEEYIRAIALESAHNLGRREGKAEILIFQLEEKYGPQSNEMKERVRISSSDDLERWSRRLLKVDTLDDVFKE